MRRKSHRRSKSASQQSSPTRSAKASAPISAELAYALVRRRSMRAQALQQYDQPDFMLPLSADPRLLLKPL